MELTLRQLQMLQLETAKEIRRICEKHNIRYFLADGSLLGAVRHQGFIPWDDDLDLGMELEAFQKFLKVAPEELDDRFLLQTWDNDPNYGGIFPKVRMKHTYVAEAVVPREEICKGVWVDVFLMVPTDRACLSGLKLRFLWLLARSYRIKCGYAMNRLTENKMGRLVNTALSLLVRLCNQSWLKRTYEKALMKYCRPQGDSLLESDGNFAANQVFDRKWFEDAVMLPFEDTHFPAPADYDAVLTTLYGDYMQPPPVELREKGHSLTACTAEREFETYFR